MYKAGRNAEKHAYKKMGIKDGTVTHLDPARSRCCSRRSRRGGCSCWPGCQLKDGSPPRRSSRAAQRAARATAARARARGGSSSLSIKAAGERMPENMIDSAVKFSGYTVLCKRATPRWCRLASINPARREAIAGTKAESRKACRERGRQSLLVAVSARSWESENAAT